MCRHTVRKPKGHGQKMKTRFSKCTLQRISPITEKRLHGLETLEARYCLSTIAFLPAVDIECCPARAVISVSAADLDHDGDFDVISSEARGRIVWYENSGRGDFSRARVISNDAGYEPTAIPFDVDNDGDVDVLFGSHEQSHIAWHENLDGEGTFSEPKVISSSTSDQSYGLISASDLDGDGDLDVLTYRSEDEIARILWYENKSGVFENEHVITDNAGMLASIHAADLDSDGDMDILTASWYEEEIAWYENTSGSGEFGESQAISVDLEASFAFAADLDGDRDMDVVSVSEQRSNQIISWHENSNGRFSTARVIAVTTNLRRAAAVDIDNDGDLDIVSTSQRGVAWSENEDGGGSFGSQKIVTESPQARGAIAVHAADLDGDGDLDVLSGEYSSSIAGPIGDLAWYEHTDGRGTFGAQRQISPQRATDSYAVDLDLDGDLDVLSINGFDRQVLWNENLGSRRFTTARVLATGDNARNFQAAADLDGDGDIDVLTSGDQLVWYQNTDGTGSLATETEITSKRRFRFFDLADLDGNSALDIIASQEDQIIWMPNDETGRFLEHRQIAMVGNGEFVDASDFDRDGDVDILFSSYKDKTVSLSENRGDGSFEDPRLIITDPRPVDSFIADDLNGDGVIDVLLIDDREIRWYAYQNGLFGARRLIPTVSTDEQFGDVYVADLDGDGDKDIVHRFGWYENTDGMGNFEPSTIGSVPLFHKKPADLDGDGDLDILSMPLFTGSIAWHENRSVGDSNDDGLFRSSDLVAVLRAGKYATGEYANFDQGDWNGDGVFDSGDIVLALQVGTYVSEASP